MTLSDMMADDAANVFTSTSDFAESVVYYPYNYYGQTVRASRTINAVVIRMELQAVTQDGGQAVLPVWEVHVANDDTIGIASDELDLGGDQISMPPRDGVTAERRSITRLLFQDSAMLVLECR